MTPLTRNMKPGALLLVFALALVPAAAHAALDILYINRCVGGCVLNPGTDDAINRKSSLLSSQVTMPAFPHSNAVFDATVSCVRSLFASYDVDVVTINPGAVARREVVLSGQGSMVGVSGTFGVAPWQQGVPINNVIAYAFAADIGANVDQLCWVAAQQFGTLYGLDFEYYCSDEMSYLSGCGTKTFTNFDAQCGTSGARTCQIPGSPSTQNSAARLSIVPGRAEVVFRGLFEAPGPSP
jgi:hypothetical protein